MQKGSTGTTPLLHPLHFPKSFVRCILESCPFFCKALSLLEPWRNCRIQHSRGVWICMLENSKSLYKPNIKKLEWKGTKTMFGSFSAILWILLASQTPRQMTLCCPRDEKKPLQVETCLGVEWKIRLGEISNTFLEAQKRRDISGWNM